MDLLDQTHQISWGSYQNLMVTMGFVRSVPIKSNKNPIKISWWPIGFARSNHIKSNGNLGNMSWGTLDLLDQSHQIQWESYQNVMDSHEIGQIKPHQIQ